MADNEKTYIRVSKTTRGKLKMIAAWEGGSMTNLVDKMAEEYAERKEIPIQ